ncbi:hypothetical protein EV715DRAFT_196974 [Schizophyllum commune]
MSAAVPIPEGFETRCGVCAAPTSMRCSRCGSAYYCSKDHSAMDWKYHKKQCNSNQVDPSAAASFLWPTKNTLQAILLPADANEPRMVEVEYEWGTDSGLTGFPMHVQNLKRKVPGLFHDRALVFEEHVETFGIHGRELKDEEHLVIMYNDLGSMHTDHPNRCVQHLTKGKAPHEWTDTLLVLRQRPRDRLLRYQSANLDEDIEILRQYFLEYDVGGGGGRALTF